MNPNFTRQTLTKSKTSQIPIVRKSSKRTTFTDTLQRKDAILNQKTTISTVETTSSPQLSKLSIQRKSMSQTTKISRKLEKKVSRRTIFNTRQSRILYTDFWSETMKKEVVRMGRIDALRSYEKIDSRFPDKKIEKVVEEKLPLFDIFQVKHFPDRNCIQSLFEKKPKHPNMSREINYIMEICNDTRELNKKLKIDISRTSLALKNQCKGVLNKSAY